MDLLRLGAFVFLQLIAAHVPPPTNVTLHCNSLQQVVEWSYDHHTPGLKFKVEIRSTLESSSLPAPQLVESPILRANVSFVPDSWMDYCLTVTAIDGKDVSDPAPADGIVFSYYQNSPAPKKCFLDFPAVHVIEQLDDNVLLSFEHPGLLYPLRSADLSTRSRKKKSNDAHTRLPNFTYEVIINKERHKNLGCVNKVCEQKLPVEAARDKHCLEMSGQLEKVSIQGTQHYCALPLVEKTSHNYLIYILVPVVVVVVVVLLLVMIYRKKTKASSTPTPNSIRIPGGPTPRTWIATRETVDAVHVVPSSPTPLLSDTEGDESTVASTPFTESGDRLSIRMSNEDEGVGDDTAVQQQREMSLYERGGTLEEDESEPAPSAEAPSNYEIRNPVIVTLGSDEQAEGYRGRGEISDNSGSSNI